MQRLALSENDHALLLRLVVGIERVVDYITATSSDASDVTVECVDDVADEVVVNESHGLRAPDDEEPAEPEEFIHERGGGGRGGRGNGRRP